MHSTREEGARNPTGADGQGGHGLISRGRLFNNPVCRSPASPGTAALPWAEVTDRSNLAVSPGVTSEVQLSQVVPPTVTADTGSGNLTVGLQHTLSHFILPAAPADTRHHPHPTDEDPEACGVHTIALRVVVAKCQKWNMSLCLADSKPPSFHCTPRPSITSSVLGLLARHQHRCWPEPCTQSAHRPPRQSGYQEAPPTEARPPAALSICKLQHKPILVIDATPTPP